MTNPNSFNKSFILEAKNLTLLISALSKRGYTVIGPKVRDSAIVFDEIISLTDLPIGYSEVQNGGAYRLDKKNHERLFDYVVGPQSVKKYLFPSFQKLWGANKSKDGFNTNDADEKRPKLALLGIRPCELAAIEIQDKIFSDGPYKDPHYNKARKQTLIMAVNCANPGGTCFCESMGTGPKAISGYDLALTEIYEGGKHWFLINVGSNSGSEIAQEIKLRQANDSEKKAAEETMAQSSKKMGRSLNTANVKELLYRNFDNPIWEKIADRCLTCGNCTMVCPTCFCSSAEDTSNLPNTQAERWRKWDTCFSVDYSYIHGGSIRQTARARYRQWMMHKLSYWVDQFGVSGCVGCGRCITWCPVGIDITEEARAIRESELAKAKTTVISYETVGKES